MRVSDVERILCAGTKSSLPLRQESFDKVDISVVAGREEEEVLVATTGKDILSKKTWRRIGR
jgi:hypothetical protein